MKKSMLTVLVVMMVVVIALAGCSKGNNNQAQNDTPPPTNNNNEVGIEDGDTGEDSGVWQLGDEPIEFSLYGHYDWYVMPKWGDDPTSTWIKDNKKVQINEVSSGGAAAQKFNTMIASNELPEVIWTERGADVEKLREAGMLVPFDDYLDKYTNLVEWMGDDLNMLRSEDGKLYQFPNWYSSRPFGNAGYVVNKKIYEELGSPPLETTDDLYNYLVLVKENYPNVVPFEPHLAKDGQGLDVLYTAFGEEVLYQYTNIRAVPDGDQLKSIFTDETFREAQRYISKLFREKLISQDALTQTLDQITEKVMSGRVAVFAGASPTTIAMEAHVALTADDPDAGYFMIWPIHKPGLDKNKIYPGTYTSLGWNVSVITTAAKDPEKIFAFLDWLTGPEGQSVLMWGPPGGYWTGEFDGEGFPVFTEAYGNDPGGVAELQADNDPFMWNGNTVYVDTAKAKFESTLPLHQRNWATHWQYEITWQTQANATEFINLNPMPDSEEGIIRQSVDDIFTEARARSLMAKSDEEVNQIWDKAEADAQKVGYEKLLQWRTQKWQENLNLLRGN